jgi:hypothetical protein
MIEIADHRRCLSFAVTNLKLVRVERIELSTKRWQRLILPLNYTRIFGGDRGNRILLDILLARENRSPLLSPNIQQECFFAFSNYKFDAFCVAETFLKLVSDG